VNTFPPTAVPARTLAVRRYLRPAFGATELLVISTAIGVLVLIVLPQMDYSHSKVDDAAHSLATTLYAARREAIARHHDMVIAFDQRQRRALLLYDVNGNGVADSGERVRAAPLDEAVVFGRGIAPPRPMGAAAINLTRTAGGLPAVVFHRDGSASGTGGLYLTSARAQATAAFASDARAVEVARATGRAEWWRFDGESWKSVKSEE